MPNLENPRARVRGGGFKPFKLHLSGGRGMGVARPEGIAISRNLVPVATGDGSGPTIDPLHLGAVSEEATPSAPLKP
ncbi:MAG: hypothetical protein ACKVYV_10775 [Limisphaerales bacterium]